ncbi:MAG: UDP-N-acetylmuramoyl-L-alanyl-D-glutamate--2,6-diaminopimelate ligase [Planctomycetes bacterium]|nr:UDP-N-acetylmuramoyl-L-alanyl-D-glutamate--2,6-diaminopimelate ligase [Planctomycetota bacterium]
MDLGLLIEGVNVRAVHGPLDVRVCDVTEDSRTIVPGSLFVARQGEVTDGRRYAADAADAGAVAVLSDKEPIEPVSGVTWVVAEDAPLATAVVAERFFGCPSRHLTLIGVTGTNGKTTVAWMIQRMMIAAGVPCGLMGTIVVDDGVQEAPATLTTPPAIELSRTLGVMREAGLAAAVIEVSSHALAQKRSAAIDFDVAVFTNLSGDHLDYHGTGEAYASAKARLFEQLGAGGTAIVNADDPSHERMVRDCRASIVRCTIEGAAAECSATIVEMGLGGSRLSLRGPWGRAEVSVSFTGRHNAMNVLEAVAACHAVGVADPTGVLSQLEPPPGRLQRVGRPDHPIAVFVDYAHTDDALEKVLSAVRPMVEGRLWVVFGCGGDRDRTKRARMGAVASRLADVVVVTSDNPRTEDPEAIIAQVRGGIDRALGESLLIEPDRAKAIRLAIGRARDGDLIVIAGKGHEDYQILPDGRGSTVRRHFDDSEVAAAALRERGLEPMERAATIGTAGA